MTEPTADRGLFTEPDAPAAEPGSDSPDSLTSDSLTSDSSDSLTSDSVTPTPEKDPADWVTGDEPMTGPQESYLSTLAQEAGREVPTGLSKADASRLIDQLQAETGRGR